MITIAFLQEKGGVGKTTMSATTATILAQRGQRVLLVDADAQGHSTLFVRHGRRDGIYALLNANATWDKVLLPVSHEFYGGVQDSPIFWLLPSSDGTSKLANGLDPRLLKARLGQVAQGFDFCIIDTSPAISDLHLSFYVAADYIIYPTECTYMPLQGLFKSIAHLEQAQAKVGSNIQLAQMMGILPTKFNGREAVQHQNRGFLMGKYEGKVFSPIRRLADWEKASQLSTMINMLGFKTRAADEAEAFVDEIFERLGAEADA